jgi:alcohol dehydrogenase (NADP+)
VLIAWKLQRGISTIPKPVSPAQLGDILSATEIDLTPADLERIRGVDQPLRLVDGCFWLMEVRSLRLQTLRDEP